MSDENQKINAVIMEIRAGVGGEEAALFANDLYRMYTRYAQNQGWSVETFDLKQTDINGIKEVIFEIKGDDVYNKLKMKLVCIGFKECLKLKIWSRPHKYCYSSCTC